jgi:hypothetical protein
MAEPRGIEPLLPDRQSSFLPLKDGSNISSIPDTLLGRLVLEMDMDAGRIAQDIHRDLGSSFAESAGGSKVGSAQHGNHHNHDLGYSAEAGQLVEMLDFRSLPQIRKNRQTQ